MHERDDERLLLRVDRGRARANDFPRYWPITKIGLGLMAECATPELADRLLEIVRLGDRLCSK